ncbi:hypothetical protein KM043_009294 [Ampulex compressa]|nr:hypothetical protein KM043_009294 [Ampulex compressa]
MLNALSPNLGTRALPVRAVCPVIISSVAGARGVSNPRLGCLYKSIVAAAGGKQVAAQTLAGPVGVRCSEEFLARRGLFAHRLPTSDTRVRRFSVGEVAETGERVVALLESDLRARSPDRREVALDVVFLDLAMSRISLSYSVERCDMLSRLVLEDRLNNLY